jgi:hypothetical protein
MKPLRTCLFLCVCIVFFGFTLTKDNVVLNYNFDTPASSLVLPPALHEISGLAIIDTSTIACIQDENGILFFYDLENNKIKQQFTFGLNGDYEGITRVANTLYVLRSDGVLFEITNYRSGKLKVKTYGTGIPATNNEGLCYDSLNNRLLIGAKGKINKDAVNKDKRFIYAFNLTTKILLKEPVFTFNTGQINAFAKNSGLILPKRQAKNGKILERGFKLNTSEIAIHPVTKQLYVLSATDHCLFIFHMNGTIEKVEPLNSILFNKAEGLCFFPNGDLLVSNEGQMNKPTLLRFNYK